MRFPPEHLLTVALVDQAATDNGAEDALAHLCLHFGYGGGIQPGRRMKVHARLFVRNVGRVVNVANASRLEYPIHDAAVEVDVCVQA